jgi:PAS domain S-box-containing protein
MGSLDENTFRPIYFTQRSLRLGKWLCGICLAIPILNFLGRFLHLRLLSKIHQDLPPMTPNTSFVLLAFAICIFIMLSRKNLKFGNLIPIVCSVGILVGFGTIVEYVSGINLRIDNVGRPSFLSSINTMLMGVSIILAYKNIGRTIFQYITLFILSVCLVVVTGYLFSTKNFHGFPIFVGAAPMALNTAIAFTLLSIALLCVDPKRGFMNLLTSSTQSGHFARGMSLAILTVPPALGLLTRLGTMAGIINVTFQISIFMLLLIAFWFIITWRLTRKGEEKELEILSLSEKLKVSEEKIKLVLNKASDGIFTANLDGIYTDVNEAGCSMLGLSRKEIIGKHIREFLPKEEFQKLDKKLETIRHDEVPGLMKWNMKTHSGEFIPVEVSDTLLKDGRWIGIVRNIKDRVEAEKILQNSERKFRGLLEDAQDAVVIVNSTGRIVFVNHQVLNWFGYIDGELAGKPIEVLVPERFRKKHVSQRNGYLENPISRPMGRDLELFGLRKDGSEFPIDVALSPSESSEGRIVTAVIRDNTEIKKREAEINFLSDIGSKISETLDIDAIMSKSAELIVPNLADCCVIRSLDDGLRFKAKKVLHRFPEEQKKLEEYAEHMETSQEIRDTLTDIIMKGESFVSIGGIKSDHIPFSPYMQSIVSGLNIHSFVVVPLSSKNAIVGTISFILVDPCRSFELSDVKFFESVALRICLSMENAKLYKVSTQAVKTREDVLSIVSHDLKNPLAFISLKTELLTRSKELSIEKVNDFSKGIMKATKQMQILIQDLLDFAKLESGTMTLDVQSHDVNSLISPLIDITTTQATDKKILFDVKIDPEIQSIRCDDNRIRQVISNLIGNAIKFTKNGGAILLELKKDDSNVLFIISDNGPGICPEDLEKIFERFWQSRDTRKMGSGLGLSICRYIVEAHGGKIWAESKIGEGSKFYFSLPQVNLLP